MPIPGTSVLHPDFQAHHAPVAEAGMTATVDIGDPDQPGTETYDRATGQTTLVPGTPVHSAVPARVQPLTGGGARVVAGQDVLTPPYLVAIPARFTADENWVVVVRACDDDAALVGRRLTVRRVAYASTRLERDLFCDDQ